MDRTLSVWGKRFFKAWLAGPLRLSGYKIEKNHVLIHDMRGLGECPTPLEGMYSSRQGKYVVDVPLELLGSTGLINTWVKVLQAYDCGGKKAALRSFTEYFENFRPKNVADFLNVAENKEWLALDPLAYVYPWDASTPEEKKEFRLRLMRDEAHKNGFVSWRESDGWKGFGPVSNRMVEMELKRLLDAYHSIQSVGLKEEFGLIRGRIFATGREEVVQPRHGWHRVAICLALEIKSIPMLFDKNNTVIRLEEAHLWPNVRRGLYTEEEAVDIFNRRFERHLQERSTLKLEKLKQAV